MLVFLWIGDSDEDDSELDCLIWECSKDFLLSSEDEIWFEFWSNCFQDRRLVLIWPKESSVIFGDNSISISQFEKSPFEFLNPISFEFFELESDPKNISLAPKCCGLWYGCVEGFLDELLSLEVGIRFSKLIPLWYGIYLKNSVMDSLSNWNLKKSY